jgi:predicted transcriptional regulator
VLELSMAKGNVEALRRINTAITHIKQILENTDKIYEYNEVVRVKLEYVLKQLEKLYDLVSYCE